MSEHMLKVVQPYFDAIASGDKTFEVRLNDRGYQKGDLLRLREWVPSVGRWGSDIVIHKRVTFVYSGDPRFGGIEPGYVVLGLGDPR